MSDYEKINVRVKEQKAARKTWAAKKLAVLLAIVLAVALAFLGLEFIGFISELFLVILIAITICVGSFKAGYICRDIKS